MVIIYNLSLLSEKENDLKEAEKKSEMQKKVSQSTVAKLKEKKKELENEKELSNTLKLEVSVLKSRLDKTDASDLNSKLCDRLAYKNNTDLLLFSSNELKLKYNFELKEKSQEFLN